VIAATVRFGCVLADAGYGLSVRSARSHGTRRWLGLAPDYSDEASSTWLKRSQRVPVQRCSLICV
jgi:SRSO17 transposase